MYVAIIQVYKCKYSITYQIYVKYKFIILIYIFIRCLLKKIKIIIIIYTTK